MEALQLHVAMRGLYMLLRMGYGSCRVSSAAARVCGQHLRLAASGAFLKPVAGTAWGGSLRCCMQRGKQQRSVLGDVLRVCCQCHGSIRCRKARWMPVLDGTVSSSTSSDSAM